MAKTRFPVDHLPGRVGAEMRRRGSGEIALLDETPHDTGDKLLMVGLSGGALLLLLLDHSKGRVHAERVARGSPGLGGAGRIRWARAVAA
jgi:hypothetical protein